MNLLEAIKKKYKELANRKANSVGNVPADDLKPIPALKKKIDDCTKDINDAIEKCKEKEYFTNMLKKFAKDLKKSLDKVDKKQKVDNWDFYRMCRLLEMAVMQWCTSSPPFSKEIMLYILIGLTKSKWNSVPDINSLEITKIVIKESDNSVDNDVKKSLQNLVISLVKVYFLYGVEKPKVEAKSPLEGIKEFKREEIKNDDNKSRLGKGSIGSVHEIQYKGKNGKIKSRAEKNLQPQFSIDGEVVDYAQAYIVGNKLVEDKFEKIIHEHKKKKEEYEKLKLKPEVDEAKLKALEEEVNKLKDKYRSVARVKVRKKDGGFSMFADVAEGDLSRFYYLDESVNGKLKDSNLAVKLDNGEKVDRLFKDLTTGVDQLHKVGLVHGDIKPTNILAYKTKSGGLKYKISDFDTVSEVEGYKDVNSHTYHYIPDCYDARNRIPDGETAKRVDCYSICMTLREIFDIIDNFGGKKPQSLQKHAEGLVAKYEKKHSCSRESFPAKSSAK